jgi:putative ATP-dependent endonuclease of OLD family
VRAIDYVTGGYIPGAPAIASDPEDEEVGVAGMDGTVAAGA